MADALNPHIPLDPPREWFTPPDDMPADAGCVVEPNGRVYGYLCHWGSVLMDGTNDRWKPPRSRHGYAFAHTGDTVCEDGSTIRTANLGGDAGHAAPGQSIEAVQAFYENTSTQMARVRYGEDANGVWFAGACWPTVTDLDIARMRASARSGHWCVVGDWKDIASGRQGYELVGACLVNIPGLKYARADRAASGVLMINPVAMASGADHEGAMVALFLDQGVAGELAIDGGEPAERLHVTLAYFEDAAAERDDWSDIHAIVRAVSGKHLPIEGVVAGQGVFYQDDGGVVHWASPDVPGISALREDLVAALNAAGFRVRDDHGFTPHITLRYDGPSDGAVVDAPVVPVMDVKFDKLTLAVGGDMTKLAAKTPEAPKAERHERVASQGTVVFQAEDGDEPVLDAAEVAVGGVLVVEGAPTEDGRLIPEGAAEWRELPLPLYASTLNLPGHDSAALVGRIDEVYRSEDDPKRIEWRGVIVPTMSDGAGQHALDAIGSGALRGISIDGIVGPDDWFIDGNDQEVMQRITIAGATLTPMPAIAEASVTLLAGKTETMVAEPNTELQEDGATEDEVAAENADADRWAAVQERLSAIDGKLDALLEAVASSEMAARYARVERALAERQGR